MHIITRTWLGMTHTVKIPASDTARLFFYLEAYSNHPAVTYTHTFVE